MRIVNFRETGDSLASVIDQAINDADYTVVTRDGEGDAVVMSLEYFSGLLETVHLLKSPANAAHLEKSIAQYREGQMIERELIDE